MKLYRQMKSGGWFMHCPCGKNWVAQEKETQCPLCKEDIELKAKLLEAGKALSKLFNKQLAELA